MRSLQATLVAEVTLNIGGYRYKIACRDGEEAHLLRLGEIVDVKTAQGRAAVGNTSEVRQILLAALLIADEATDNQTPTAAPTHVDDDLHADALEALATRIESLAARLENSGKTF